MKHMFLDTEYENSPRRLISIAYIIVEDNNIISTTYKLIKHNIHIFQIDETGIAFNKHKITNFMCQKEGETILNILKRFSKDLDNIDCIVGHNLVAADISTIRREAIGENMWNELRNKIKSKKLFDTIKEIKKKNKLESYSLDKVYKKITQKDFNHHHDALEDCKATYEIFKYLNIEKENENMEEVKMNFPEDEIEKQSNIICLHCNKNIKNYYNIKKKDYEEKYQKYNFKLYSINKIVIGESLCSKCYENIEVIKYYQNEMVDILNKNINKNCYKYNTDFLDVKKSCFEYIEKKK